MTITYSFETSTMTNLNGKKNKETKSIVDGDKGVTIYFLRKTDSDFKKVKVIKIIIDMVLALKIIIQNLRLKIKFIHLYKILSF